ncbi:hypothetical protein U1Q18_047025 [Sarracenia purpurea var. burkii]
MLNWILLNSLPREIEKSTGLIIAQNKTKNTRDKIQIGVDKVILRDELPNWTEAIGVEVKKKRKELGEQGGVCLRQLVLQLTQLFQLRMYVHGELRRVYETRDLFPQIHRSHGFYHCKSKP